MEFPLCNHLRDYRDQFLRTESAYAALLTTVHGFRGTQPARTPSTTGQAAAAAAALATALEEWRHETGRLRTLLVELVKAGRVVLPQGQGTLPRCAECRCAIHRFECTEWPTQADGAIIFQGEQNTKHQRN